MRHKKYKVRRPCLPIRTIKIAQLARQQSGNDIQITTVNMLHSQTNPSSVGPPDQAEMDQGYNLSEHMEVGMEYGRSETSQDPFMKPSNADITTLCI